MQYTLALSVDPAYCSLVYMIHAFRLSSTGMGAYPSILSRLDSPWRNSKSWRTSSWNQRTRTLKIDSIANQECNIKQLYVFRVLHSAVFSCTNHDLLFPAETHAIRKFLAVHVRIYKSTTKREGRFCVLKPPMSRLEVTVVARARTKWKLALVEERLLTAVQGGVRWAQALNHWSTCSTTSYT